MLVGEVAPAHLSDVTLATMDDSVAPSHISDVTLATKDDSVPPSHWRERRRLTGHQRRVAAVSFLANIPGQGGPGYRCLQGTRVLESYRRSRARRRGAARDAAPEQRAASNEKSQADSAPSRKMTSARLNSSGCQEVMGRKRPSYGSQWSEEVVDSSSSRRARHNSSSESLGPLVPLNMDRERLRKISGTSHGSHASHGSSVREVTFIKAEDHGKITEERLVFISHSKVPFYITSCIPFHKSSKSTRDVGPSRRHRHPSGSRPLPAINDSFDAFELLGLERTEAGQEISYCELLEPSYSGREQDRSVQQPLDLEGEEGKPSPRSGRGSPQQQNLGVPEDLNTWGQPLGSPYSPHTLDGWLGAGKHRTFLPFPSYITSIIEYVKPSDMKKELNEKFSERFPQVQLTLSKLRSIKLETRRIGLDCDVDIVTIAQAYVYFEKLVLRKVINKDNRKFCAGASLILAAKLNDVKGEQLKSLIERTETVFRLNRRDLLASEFAILVALEFSLHVPSQEVYPHYQRLLYQT